MRSAAYYHDLGLVRRRDEHESMSVLLAADMLPQYGYGDAQIESIAGQIMATRLPQMPENLLEEIVADADLAVLGQSHFLKRNGDLRRELVACGVTMSDEEWYLSQLDFIKNHRYFTSTAEALYGAGKARNVRLLEALLLSVRG